MGIADGLFNQNITSISSVSLDGRNNKTTTVVYSDVKCRWRPSKEVVLDSNNEEQIAIIEAWIPAEFTVLYDYQVIFNSKTYNVTKVEQYFNVFGELDHNKLYLT